MPTTRAERVAANRAIIEARIGTGRFAVRGAREPMPVRVREPSEPAYVEVGQCPKCKLTWRTNLTGGEIKKHWRDGKPCGGWGKVPTRHTVVLKSLYRPGEKWPKSWA